MKKNYVKTVLCVPVFLWIMGASVLFAQEVKAVKLKETAKAARNAKCRFVNCRLTRCVGGVIIKRTSIVMQCVLTSIICYLTAIPVYYWAGVKIIDSYGCSMALSACYFSMT